MLNLVALRILTVLVAAVVSLLPILMQHNIAAARVTLAIGYAILCVCTHTKPDNACFPAPSNTFHMGNKQPPLSCRLFPLHGSNQVVT